MNKPFRMLVALAAAAGALALAPVPEAAAIGVSDLRVDLTSIPEEVSPPGELVKIEAQITDPGPFGNILSSGGELTVDLAPGSEYRDDLSTAACSPIDIDSALCPVGAGGGTFEIVGHTPEVVGVATSHATITPTGPLAALEDPAGNTDSVDTYVVAGDPVVVDLTVELASRPGEVSPPGDLVLIEAVVTDPGPLGEVVSSGGELTVDLAPGSEYRDDLSTEACLPVDVDSASCPVEPGGGTFEVVGSTPTTTGTATTTATITPTGPLAPFEDPAGNTDSVDTEVTAPGQGVAAGLVEEGDSITLEANDGTGRTYTLEVPEGAGPGVIVEINLVDNGETYSCGSSQCEDGFHTDFAQHPYFKAEDPQNPLISRKTFGPQPPCKGLGGRCAEIWFAKSLATTQLEKMPPCAGASGGEAGFGDALPSSPCVNQKYKQGGVIWFDVRMLSNDPVELPPLRV